MELIILRFLLFLLCVCFVFVFVFVFVFFFTRETEKVINGGKTCPVANPAVVCPLPAACQSEHTFALAFTFP